MLLSQEQRSALNRDNRQFSALDPTGAFTFADFIQDLLDAQEQTSAGITANSWDVNSVALTGVVASWDSTTTPGTDLNFAWRQFRFHNGKAHVTVSAGSILLSASATNYVEVDRAGTVTKNTTGFTSGRFPLFQVVTGASTYSSVNVTGRATPYTLLGDNGVDGSMLSTAAQTKEVVIGLGTLSATAAVNLIVPTQLAAASKLTKARFVTKDALATDNTNYWDFGLVNKQTGAGAQTLADRTAAANSTKTTGGSALVAYAGRDLTLVTLSVGNERDVTGAHTLEFTATKNGTAANLTQCYLILEFTFTN